MFLYEILFLCMVVKPIELLRTFSILFYLISLEISLELRSEVRE